MDEEKVEMIYIQLKDHYKLFSEFDNEWSANNLDSTPFKNLVSTMLSTMTHSKRVAKAATGLFAAASTPEDILKLEDDQLTELIKPVAHYNHKTKLLKQMCTQLIERHDGQVPSNRTDLLALSGVGPKVADLVMNFTFGSDEIAVDTHIHRLLNRTGVVETKSALETSKEINDITPAQYKKHAHEWLIQHGMQVCIARKPKCDQCIIKDSCEYENKNL